MMPRRFGVVRAQARAENMPYQIISLVLDFAVGLAGGACLLRLYMQQQRIPMSARAGNPMGPFLFALTDWIVLPLRRVLPGLAALDLASLLAAWLLSLAQCSILWLFQGMPYGYPVVAVLAVVALVRLLISGLTLIVMLFALVSWVQARSPAVDLLDRLVVPLLVPIRRQVPLIGGVDLSPVVLLLLLQVASLLLNAAQGAVLMAMA
jgi:YggT family protein